jgi:WD40 repeat protein
MSFDLSKVASKTVFKHPETFLAVALDHVALDHDAGEIYCGGYDRFIHRLKLAGDKIETVAKWRQHDSYVSSLAVFRAGGKPVIISGGYDGALVWSDIESGSVIRRVTAHNGWLRRLKLLPGGERFVTVGDDMLARLWETRTGKLIRAFEGHAKKTPQHHPTALYAVAVSSDGKHIATGDRIGDVRVWRTDDGSIAANFQVPVLYTYDPRERHRSIGGIRSLAFSPDDKFLAVGGIGQVGNVDGLAGPATVEVWNWRSPRRITAFGAEKHKALVNSLIFHPKHPILIGAGGGGDNGLLALWKLDDLPKIADPSEPPGSTRRSSDKNDKNSDDAPTLPVRRIKFEGHAHDCALTQDATHLYAAGHNRLELWRLA